MRLLGVNEKLANTPVHAPQESLPFLMLFICTVLRMQTMYVDLACVEYVSISTARFRRFTPNRFMQGAQRMHPFTGPLALCTFQASMADAEDRAERRRRAAQAAAARSARGGSLSPREATGTGGRGVSFSSPSTSVGDGVYVANTHAGIRSADADADAEFVLLPCEACGALVPPDNLIEHTLACDGTPPLAAAHSSGLGASLDDLAAMTRRTNAARAASARQSGTTAPASSRPATTSPSPTRTVRTREDRGPNGRVSSESSPHDSSPQALAAARREEARRQREEEARPGIVLVGRGDNDVVGDDDGSGGSGGGGGGGGGGGVAGVSGSRGCRKRKVAFGHETLAMLHKVASRVREHPDDAK
jgi:hypothetical protein